MGSRGAQGHGSQGARAQGPGARASRTRGPGALGLKDPGAQGSDSSNITQTASIQLYIDLACSQAASIQLKMRPAFYEHLKQNVRIMKF